MKMLLLALSLFALSSPAFAEKQCRVGMLDPSQYIADPQYSEWVACGEAEKSADALAVPGMTVWTEERTSLPNGKWTEPIQHTDPELIPMPNPLYLQGTYLREV
jgi:hypothetical protein